MIQNLRKRFVIAAMLTLTLVLGIILGIVNFIGYQKMVSDADNVLSLLAENQGRFPQMDDGLAIHRHPQQKNFRPMSAEVPFESRFFSVTVENGEVTTLDMDRIAAIDAAAAAQLAEDVLSSGQEIGFRAEYRFRIATTDAGSRIIFLDCGRNLSSLRTTLLASLVISALGLTAVLLILIPISAKIVKPVAESYEKQRQFITDAGHELKTPLTVIQADADLIELEQGESEWLEDIRHQAQRLTELTKSLITLSRMEEAGTQLQFVDFPLSDVVEETAHDFLALSIQQNKTLEQNLAPQLTLRGNEAAIRQLLTILLDNALKYSPEHTAISLRLTHSGREHQLSLTNVCAAPLTVSQTERLFDRFYRADSSRNSPGYGLGLAIAKSIVSAHGGTIKAELVDCTKLRITASFPA